MMAPPPIVNHVLPYLTFKIRIVFSE